MEHFQIRTYGKGELAQLYNPHVTQAAACRKLMHWISLQPQLQEVWEEDFSSSTSFKRVTSVL